MENDSDFQDGEKFLIKISLDYSNEMSQNYGERKSQYQCKKYADSHYIPYNEEFEIKREKMVSILFCLILRQR